MIFSLFKGIKIAKYFTTNEGYSQKLDDEKGGGRPVAIVDFQILTEVGLQKSTPKIDKNIP
jgi:hypothetical protein